MYRYILPLLLFVFLSAATFATTSRSAGITIIYDTVHVDVCAGDSYSGYNFTISSQRTKTAGEAVKLSRYIKGVGDNVNIDTQFTLVAHIIDNPEPMVFGPETFCQGSSATLVAAGAERYKWSTGDTVAEIHVYATGDYVVTGLYANGCYNRTTFHVEMQNPIIYEETRHVCQGDTTFFHDEPLFESCRRIRWDQNAAGCDSQTVVYVEVTPVPDVVVSGNTSLCSGNYTDLSVTGADSYVWSTGQTTATARIYIGDTIRVVGTTRFGCSAETVVVTYLKPVFDTHVYDTVCLGESVNFYQHVLRGTGSLSVTDQSADGCDSVVTLHLQVNRQTYYEFTEYVTNSYTWNDSLFTQWGDYSMVFTGSNGCDSTATLHLGVIVDMPRPSILVNDDRLLVVDHYPGGADSSSVSYEAYRWVRNGEVVQWWGDAYHLPAYSKLKGCYWVEVLTDTLDHWMPSNMICVDDTYDGISDAEAPAVALYPNPVVAGGRLHIDAGFDAANAMVQIIDQRGAVVAARHFGDAEVAAPAVRGVYAVRVVTADGSVAVSKLLVK